MANPKEITILVDIDDVIENLGEAWIAWLNREHQRSVDWFAIDDWDITKFYPGLTKEQIFEPLHNEDFWYTVEPKQDAIAYLKALFNEGFDIYLCTTTDYRNIRPKYEAIVQRYFPFIPWPKVIVTSRKQMIQADFLVDDAPHNLEGGSYTKILFSAGHNRNYDAAGNGMYRVNDWSVVYLLIHAMTDR